MTQKTILFIAPSAYPLGGVQTWLDYLLPGLNGKGWRAILGLVSGKFHDVEAYQKVHPYKNVVRIESTTGSRQGRVNAMVETIERVNPDIVAVVNIVDAYQAVNQLKFVNKSNVKITATLHGLDDGYLSDFSSYADTIDAVICTNRLVQHLVTAKSGIAENRAMYAPYGVEQRSDSAPDLGKEQSNSKPNLGTPLTIAYVGRIEEQQKRVGDLIQIFDKLLARHPKTKILIAGGGPDLNRIENWINDNHHHEKVKYLGVLDPGQLNEQVYQPADIMLLTSYWETGPIVAWEAMENDVLLVSSRYIGSREEGSLIDRENCLLFDIGDVDEAVACIELATDPELHQNITNHARELIAGKYTRSASIDAWDRCFQNVLEIPGQIPSNAHTMEQEPGRLSSLFGNTSGERIRKKLNINYPHSEPGGEWPHSYGQSTGSLEQLVQITVETGRIQQESQKVPTGQ